MIKNQSYTYERDLYTMTAPLFVSRGVGYGVGSYIEDEEEVVHAV